MKSDNPKATFQISWQVDVHAIDDLGHVNNVVYIQKAQEIAEQHWRYFALTDVLKNEKWVVTQHHALYKKSLFLGEEVTIITTVEDHYTGAIWGRTVDFVKNDILVCRVKTDWCLIDSTTAKPKRINREIAEVFGF